MRQNTTPLDDDAANAVEITERLLREVTYRDDCGVASDLWMPLEQIGNVA